MISVLAFNLGLIMMVIMWPLCYWINNGHYIRQYQHHLYDYRRDYFDGGYLLMLDINYISLIVSTINAGLMFCFEIFCIFYAYLVASIQDATGNENYEHYYESQIIVDFDPRENNSIDDLIINYDNFTNSCTRPFSDEMPNQKLLGFLNLLERFFETPVEMRKINEFKVVKLMSDNADQRLGSYSKLLSCDIDAENTVVYTLINRLTTKNRIEAFAGRDLEFIKNQLPNELPVDYEETVNAPGKLKIKHIVTKPKLIKVGDIVGSY